VLRRAVVALLAVVLLPLSAHAGTAHGTLSHGSYTEPGGLTRTYLLYRPAALGAGRPLVMFLHGCNQTATEAMSATGWNRLADSERFAVVYPEQTRPANSSAPAADGNGVGCWNWFLPEDQQRSTGEPAVLAGLATSLTRRLHADARRVYVEGISAGADMTVILGATYPDVFAAVGSLAGCSFRSCGDGSGQLTYQAMGKHARKVPLIAENGTADVLNPVVQSENLVRSWLGAMDLADDGSQNGSVRREPESSRTTTPDGLPEPGSGDPCVHNNSFLCAGGAAGLQDYPVTVETWQDDLVELYTVHGMAHAQPHARDGGPYTDPMGPDMTVMSWGFFSRHPR
jgi:poly(hydroxyalkanoate) depolymerase family esterase